MRLPGVVASSLVVTSLFSPAVIPGLTMWYDADDSATVTTNNNDRVLQWNDKSGNNLHAGPGQAIYRQNQINGRPAMGPVESTNIGSIQLPIHPITGTTNRTVFMVAQPQANNGSDHTLFNLGTTFRDNEAWGFQTTRIVQSDPTMYFKLFCWNNDYVTSSVLAMNVTRIFACRSNGPILDDHTLYLDGVAEQSSGTTPINTQPTGGATQAIIASGLSDFGGLIAEFIIYGTAISDADRQRVEGYLAHKWGLTANLPVGHPFKTVAP